jgi:hypothetical protein
MSMRSRIHSSIRFFIAPTLIIGLFFPLITSAELELKTTLENRYFPQKSLFGQNNEDLSLSLQPEYHYNFAKSDDSFNMKLFGRLDQQDSRRTHADIRSLNWDHVGRGGWEMIVGVDKVFWGVTESQHLVDIINQTDLVENPDGKQKLGQPMIHFSVEKDWGMLDTFILPGHRPRTFPGVDGRLRTPLPIDFKHIQYDSGAGSKHVDFAVRYSKSFNDLDFALSHFTGTSRDPNFEFNNDFLHPALLERYPTIDQTGLELQYVWESWLLKFEGITRSGQGDGRYSALTTGFEYTQVGIFDTRTDLGWVLEYLFDDRNQSAPTFFEQDVFLGLRWTQNDAASTEALLGLTYDHITHEQIVSLESSRRLGDSFKLKIDGRIFAGGKPVPTNTMEVIQYLAKADPSNKTGYFQRDDYLQVELSYYY